MKKVGIVIIAYNNSEFIRLQIELIKRFCTDDYGLIIVDNSTDYDVSLAIKYHLTNNTEVKYLKTDASSVNGSSSHSFAANVSYQMLKYDYDYFFYLDHDCFPFEKFSVVDNLDDNYALLAGVGQQKSKLYLWPGCLMFRNNQIARKFIDFSPNKEFGLDTGGNLYKIIEEVGDGAVTSMSERHVQNPEFDKNFYNFYSVIDGKFMHFINGSKWNHQAEDDERINSLLNILTQKLKIND